MTDIVQFVPKVAVEARANLKEFIRICRAELTVFGADLDWHANSWKQAGVTFGNIDQSSGAFRQHNAMKPPFIDFAKAYFRYQQGHKPTDSKVEMRALKCLERAVDERACGMELECIDPSSFDRAAVIAREHYSAGLSYHAGRELERLARFVSENRLIPRYIDWKSPIKRPISVARTGKKAQEDRERKLPAPDALDALAEIFASNPTAPRDIVTTSVCAMLLCAPSRISEIQALPEDCEVSETKRDGKRAYGWRFQPGKNGPPCIKWIPDAMVDLAQEAIRRVRDLTAEARRIASWLESHPNEFYRHKACPKVSETEPLHVIDAAAALGLNSRDTQAASSELTRVGLSGRCGGNTLLDLNKWVHARLPEDFPWFDRQRSIRYSNALFCMQEYLLSATIPTRPCGLWKITNNTVNSDICGKRGNDGSTFASIFDRHGYNEGRAAPLKVTTHQFRHLLNTYAQRGGLSQAEIARWSGRNNVLQNRVYDHMSEFELVDMLRKHDPELSLDRSLTEIAEQIATQLPMTRQEFNSLAIPTAHVTEYGFCIHDYVMSPCQRFRDCLNCTEQVCIKGDRRVDRLRTRYAQVRQLMERAEREIAEGSAGADRWYEIHALTEKRLASLLAILEDSSIPDGAIIRLNNQHEFSPLRRALDAKAIAGTLKDGHRSMLGESQPKLGHSDG